VTRPAPAGDWPAWPRELAGRMDDHVFDSVVLRDNPLGDPWRRPLWIYTPPGYDDEPDRRWPSVYVIQGYTGALPMWRNRAPFRLTYPEAADALFTGGEAGPGAPGCVLVWVDAWTRYGGSQFVDSPGTGQYHTYLCEEVVPWVDAHYRTLDSPRHRGIQGKSSGGFGAMITPMLRPDLFGGFATHAGDALYEASYVEGFAKVARALRDHYGGSYERFWADFRARAPLSKPTDLDLVMIYGVAACFSADPDGTVRLPFEPATGRLIDDVWQRWLAWDPVRMVARYAEPLRSQRAIWIDAGTRDDWYLDLGAEAFRRELESIGVVDYHFELFDATHAGIDYRYPLALAYLADRLTSGASGTGT
jgi:S-formylglutathione hydrolase FrmB